MNYEQGVAHMMSLMAELRATGQNTSFFTVGDLVITYPGRKQNGDYRVTENDIAPTHANIVCEFYALVNEKNVEDVLDFLEDMYHNGLLATTVFLSQAFKEKIYWLTLQEDINYPPPHYAGRKLPFQRFYEAVLSKLFGLISLQQVISRTNNHGRGRPTLLDTGSFRCPTFYI
jgi:hypothetical protein